jgi:hypothetical protein
VFHLHKQLHALLSVVGKSELSQIIKKILSQRFSRHEARFSLDCGCEGENIYCDSNNNKNNNNNQAIYHETRKTASRADKGEKILLRAQKSLLFRPGQ